MHIQDCPKEGVQLHMVFPFSVSVLA